MLLLILKRKEEQIYDWPLYLKYYADDTKAYDYIDECSGRTMGSCRNAWPLYFIDILKGGKNGWNE